MTKQQFKDYINTFDFTNLFNHLGWAYIKETTPVKIDAETYTLQSIAEKSGFRILICQPDKNGAIPEYPIRLKIHNNISRLFKEHLVIFINKESTQQVWQTIKHEIGKPGKPFSVNWRKGQEPELLYQKASGLIFTLAEEDNITISDVKNKVDTNFNQQNEKVTKQFYDRFKQQHTQFLKFIKGIENKVTQEWYASLMLNRLMFCYFIQKKGFLDNNKNYLTDKLKECQNKKGKNKFYSFYRNFLLQLFHKGLGAPDHSKQLTDEIGNIPYLNGGLFDTHEIEREFEDRIEIDDKAFESIFKFFNEWEWHLDTRHTASGKDINPDVIGYIFEKYINDRADMGAYYTKEDITDYISKNCIIPFLFDETRRQLPKAFNADSELWQMVKLSGDKYIYDAVKKGSEEKLPEEIAKGIKNVAARTEWNKPAPENLALPTEIWREVVDRRNRYNEIKIKIEKGEIQNIHDFITCNLNIRQFAIDSIANTNNADFLRSFYKSLNSVTIIDPTCGSGAFLFAAMNILEELYEQCIQRMRAFVEDEDRTNAGEKKVFSHKFKFFREVLENLQSPQHPNLQYFIYKNIILQNLYGVDIMKEAVEIAKLRLFLKLVATVDVDYNKPNLGLEPLPDIDFNIRSGNTLVGFGTEKELDRALDYTLDGQLAKPGILEKMEIVAKAFSRYKEIQLTYGDDYKAFKKAKEELNKRLKELNHELNLLLHKQAEGLKYEKWVENYKPFHWFAEFYEIMSSNKGFDVVVGNPPYVEYSKIRNYYSIKNYSTESCGNLYAYVFERCLKIINAGGKFGMIVPSSSFTTSRMKPLMECLSQISNWFSFYDFRPGKLFDGVNLRLAICISSINSNKDKTNYTSTYLRWYAEERDFVFSNKIFYNQSNLRNKLAQKICSNRENSILSKLSKEKKSIANLLVQNSKYQLYFHDAILYWIRATDFAPSHGDYISSHVKNLSINSENNLRLACCIMNSNLFYWYWTKISNCRDLNMDDASSFPIKESMENDRNLLKLHSHLMKDLISNGIEKIRIQKQTGEVKYMEFYPVKSKRIIDEIDETLAEHFGFTNEELDFIINYDVKYRMGKGFEEDEDE